MVCANRMGHGVDDPKAGVSKANSGNACCRLHVSDGFHVAAVPHGGPQILTNETNRMEVEGIAE